MGRGLPAYSLAGGGACEVVDEEAAGGARHQYGGGERHAARTARPPGKGRGIAHGGGCSAARVREAKAGAFMYPTTRYWVRSWPSTP